MLLIVLVFLMICYGIFGVLTIPKLQIKVPGHIPILFGWFLALPNCSPNLAPYTPYLSPKCFNEYKKNMESSLKIWFFISQHFRNPKNPDFVTLPDIKHVELYFILYGVFLIILGNLKIKNMRSPKYENISNVLLHPFFNRCWFFDE